MRTPPPPIPPTHHLKFICIASPVNKYVKHYIRLQYMARVKLINKIYVQIFMTLSTVLSVFGMIFLLVLCNLCQNKI